MNITVENGMLRCESRYHPEIVARMQSIHGAAFERPAKIWWVSLNQADRLMETFPKASFSYDAIDAALIAEARRIRNFHDSLVRLGVRFEVAGERVIGVGENISPLLQEEIAKRDADLLGLVVTAQEPQPQAEPVPPRPVAPAPEPTIVERSIVRLAQQSPRQYGRRPRRGRSKPTQLELSWETQS